MCSGGSLGRGTEGTVPVPLDGRRPRSDPARLPPHPGPGAGPPGSPASPLRPGQAFRAGIPCKTEGHPSPSQRLFRNAGRRRGQSSKAPTPSRDKMLPFPSLPPALLVSFCFSFLFYFPLSLSKGLPAFPYLISCVRVAKSDRCTLRTRAELQQCAHKVQDDFPALRDF